MSTPSIAELADRIAPDHVEQPMITPDVADELLRRVVRVHRASEELYELVARLAGRRQLQLAGVAFRAAA